MSLLRDPTWVGRSRPRLLTRAAEPGRSVRSDSRVFVGAHPRPTLPLTVATFAGRIPCAGDGKRAPWRVRGRRGCASWERLAEDRYSEPAGVARVSATSQGPQGPPGANHAALSWQLQCKHIDRRPGAACLDVCRSLRHARPPRWIAVGTALRRKPRSGCRPSRDGCSRVSFNHALHGRTRRPVARHSRSRDRWERHAALRPRGPPVTGSAWARGCCGS
jgi:hypothetical protein